MAADDEKDRGFTVVDKRGRDESAPESPPETSGDLPAIDFSTFVLSLGTSALYHLGVLPHPEGAGSPPEPNLPLARQTIDTLEMLEAKTRGNLDAEEAKLVENLLYELRMRFVEAGSSGSGESAGD